MTTPSPGGSQTPDALQKALFVASLGGIALAGVVVPLLFVGVQSMFTEPHIDEAFVASIVAAIFMGSTSLCAAAFLNSPALRAVILGVYISKCSLLVAIGLSVDLSAFNAPTIAACLTLSAVVLTVFQAVVVHKVAMPISIRTFEAGAKEIPGSNEPH